MSWKIGAISLMMVWLCAGHCTGHSSPTTGQSRPRSIVSRDYYYNRLMNNVPANCKGKSFFHYDGFVTGAEHTSGFGTTGSETKRKREVAAFLANVMHATGGLCEIKETNPSQDYCDRQFTQWPCTAGKRYFGRGPLRLTWNYNYGAAGKALGFDGLNNPEIVEQDPLVSFKVAYWFWMNNCHKAIVSGQGFGATIRAINSAECDGGNRAMVNARVNYYRRFCADFGVDPGPNVSC